MKGLGRTPSLGDRRGFMPPQLKTNTILGQARHQGTMAKESNQKDWFFSNSVMVNSSLGNHLELLLDILKIVIM